MAPCARRISAVIIAFNEEADIARALESVSWCDEILVVDSGSTDRTVEICLAHGCRVVHQDFHGYGEQKSFAVTQAANDWILAVDADEEVSTALRDEIRFELGRNRDCRGYYLPITTVLWDGVVRTARRHTKPKLRLFDRRFGNFGKQLVHESVSVEGPTEYLREPMYNYSFADFADYFDKFNRYTTLAARECFGRGHRAGVAGATLKLPVTFVQTYFMRGFILDGSVGLTWSLFASLYTAVKHLKIWELCRAEEREALKRDEDQLGQSVGQGAGLLSRLPLRLLNFPSALRRSLGGRGKDYGFATGSAALAWLLMGEFGLNEPGHYSVLAFLSVVATARFWGFGPSLAAIALGVLGLDYFALPPVGFSIPNLEGLSQMGLFAVLSLISSFLIYASRRKSLP